MSTDSEQIKQNEEIKSNEDEQKMELETTDVKQDEDQQKKDEKEQKKENENPDEMTLEDLIKTEKKSLRDRIIKQKQKVKVIEGKNFNERQNINFEDETLTLRPEVLHVYGVDFLSTQDIMSYFSRFNPEKIEWLNDSSCNVVFPSEEIVEQTVQSLSLTIQNDPNLSEEWKKGIPYKERNIEFSLYFRIATTKDVKGEQVSGKESQYYKYMRQKTQDQRQQRQSRYEDRNRYRGGNNKGYNDRGRSQQQSKRHQRSTRADTKDWKKEKLSKDNKRNKRNRSSSSQSQDDRSSSLDQKNQSKSRSRSRSLKDSNSNKSSSPVSKSPKERQQEKRSLSRENENKKSNEETVDQQQNDNDDL